MDVFAWHFPINNSLFKDTGKRTQRKEKKKMYSQHYNGLRCRVSLMMGKLQPVRTHPIFGGKAGFFLEEMCIELAVQHVSHIIMTNISCLQPWRTLEIKQGWSPSKVSEMSAKSFQPQSGLTLLSSVSLPPSAWGKTLLLTIKLLELVAGVIWLSDVFTT